MSSGKLSPTDAQPSPPPFNRINFPLYSVSALSCNHVIVTGGGGAANTGVFNGFVSSDENFLVIAGWNLYLIYGWVFYRQFAKLVMKTMRMWLTKCNDIPLEHPP